MNDPHIAFRMAVFQAINGQLIDLASAAVTVYDEKVEDGNNNTYVILSTQTGTMRGTFSGFLHDSTLLIQIITKQQEAVSKDVLDNISQQITNILMPDPVHNGLVQQPGFLINCLYCESVNYGDVKLSNTKSEIKKLLRFKAVICQN